MISMTPSAKTVDPEAGGVEVDLNGSQDIHDTEFPTTADDPNADPNADDWSEGGDAVSGSGDEASALSGKDP